MKKTAYLAMVLSLSLLMTACSQKNLANNLLGSSTPAEQRATSNEKFEYTEHTMDGLTYTLRSSCVETQPSYFVDEKTEQGYLVTGYRGTEEEMMTNFLELLSQIRMEPDFESFSFAFIEEDYITLTSDAKPDYLYNAMTVKKQNGRGTQIGQVCSGKVIATIFVSYGTASEEAATLAEVERIARSLVIDEAVVLAAVEQAEAKDQAKTEVVTQVIGNDGVGYLSVPETWVKFIDLDGATALQYSDPIGAAIISLDVFDDTGLTAEQKAAMTLETAANSAWYYLEQNGVTNIAGSKVKLAKWDAYQIYGGFISEDYSLPSMIVCWVFEEQGVFHSITAEAPVETISELIAYVESSFTLEKPQG